MLFPEAVAQGMKKLRNAKGNNIKFALFFDHAAALCSTGKHRGPTSEFRTRYGVAQNPECGEGIR
jgi:hypothetical protein